MIVDKLGGAGAKGTVIIGNCFPGFPVLENRAKGVEESLKAAPGLKVLGPFDVKVSAVDNYNHWEQLYAANPDADGADRPLRARRRQPRQAQCAPTATSSWPAATT